VAATVLVVEDDRSNRDLFFDLFTGHQMALLTAARSERMGEINAAYLDNGTIAIIH
jgi:hypothetical protein